MAAAPPEPSSRPRRDLAVLVVNWHRQAETIACVRRVQAWRSLRPKIVVVDNDSGPAAVAGMREELADVEIVVSERNRGFGGAHNLALEHVDSPWLLLLNNDAAVEEQAVAELLAFVASEPRAGLAAPLIEDARPPHDVQVAGGRDPGRYGRTHATAAEHREEIARAEPYAVDYVAGTAALVRRSLLVDLGGFDEEYFFSGEMADLCARAWERGSGSFVVPTARARHDLTAAGEHRQLLYPYYSLRNRFLYVRRRAGDRSPAPAVARWAARGFGRMLLELGRGRVRRSWALARGLADGVRGRFGPAGDRVRA